MDNPWPRVFSGAGAPVAPTRVVALLRARPDAGFSLIETLVAMAIAVTTIAGVAQLFGITAAANQRASRRTLAALAASQKLEQLHSLPGPMLTTSPAAALDDSLEGFSDIVDRGSAWGPFVRRWSIAPLPADPVHLLLLQVVMLAPDGRIEARLATVRLRRGE